MLSKEMGYVLALSMACDLVIGVLKKLWVVRKGGEIVKNILHRSCITLHILMVFHVVVL
jgi:hypothetical protein